MLTIDNKEIRIFCKKCGDELTFNCKVDELYEDRILVPPCGFCDQTSFYEKFVDDLTDEMNYLKEHIMTLEDKLENYE